jgi:hypothetical protein
VKVGFFELHCVFQRVPYADERRILVEVSRVISKWVTWPLVSEGREHQADHNYDREDIATALFGTAFRRDHAPGYLPSLTVCSAPKADTDLANGGQLQLDIKQRLIPERCD